MDNFKVYTKEGKTCSRCLTYKLVDRYSKSKRDGIQSICKDCKSKIKDSPARLERRSVRNKEKRQTDIEFQEREKKNRRNSYSRHREKRLEYAKEYTSKNKDKVRRRQNSYNKKRKEEDVVYKLTCVLRSRISRVIQKCSLNKHQTLPQYLGCSLVEFKKYVESKFTNGMSWNNHGEWHLDHIIPLCTALTSDDVYRLNHYTNLQPLWAIDNLKKGDKLWHRV